MSNWNYISASGLIEDEELFKRFKQAAYEFIENDLEDCDVGMLNIVKTLNTLPGVATRFCCEGHNEWPGDNTKVLVVARDNGSLCVLEKIIHDFNKEVLSSPNHLMATTLHLEKHLYLVCGDDDDNLFRYPAICIKSFDSALTKEDLNRLEHFVSVNVMKEL